VLLSALRRGLSRPLVRYLIRRVLFVIPQLIGITLVTFLLIRALPGDPARLLAGPLASDAGVEHIRVRMGLDQPLPIQYVRYVSGVIQGDLGDSWYTGRPVRDDLVDRIPATLELISLALILAIVIMIPLGVVTALQSKRGKGGFLDRGVFGYGLLAGAVPDFWLALVLIFVFFHILGWAPAPIGRIGLEEVPPDRITGLYTIDSIITGNRDTLFSATRHLALPVLTLFLVYGGAILRMTRATVSEILDNQMIAAGRLFGLSDFTLARYALRNALPPVVTITGVVYGFLLGGAVLVESIFAWGGMGQYAVQAVTQSDYAAIQGFVLVASTFSLLVYLVIDLLYIAIDPRIRLRDGS
jgi:ABC-type dipeptide/oligopeptide/nickel transport system permease component